MVNTKVTLCGVPLDNPVMAASGTFGFGAEFAALYDINCLGSFSFKGTTLAPRFGNPTPRIAECTSGMINAVGLQNPGVDAVISTELPKLKTYFHKPVMANVSGFSLEEYAETCRRLDSQDQIGWFEVNVSCPNVHGGGMSFGTDPAAAAAVPKAVKAVTTKPVFVKLSPNVTDIVSSASSTPCLECVSTSGPASLLSPTKWAASPAPPFSRWLCGWSTRWRGPSRSPLSAWAAYALLRT